MPNVIEGERTGAGARFAIAVSRYNDTITRKLLDGAVDTLRAHGVADEAIDVAWVPGAWEIPLLSARLAASSDYDAIVSLGVLVRGGTPHFDLLAAEVAKGLASAAIASGNRTMNGTRVPDSCSHRFPRGSPVP